MSCESSADRVNPGQTAVTNLPLLFKHLALWKPLLSERRQTTPLRNMLLAEGTHFLFLGATAHQTKWLRALRGVWKTTHSSPDKRRNKSLALWALGMLGWGARGLRWKHRWVIWSISAPQSTGAVNLNSYITSPLKTSIAGYSRHIRVTLEKLHSSWSRGWFRHQENVLHFPLITSSGLGVLF